MTESNQAETLGFQTEVRQLLQLMIHSLYSNKEIFLRELISNASDAADKIRFEALENPELFEGDSDLKVDIAVNKEAKTISISDNGIGMSRDELISNLGTIARSGTSEFLQQMTGDQQQDAQLIGQFGVGFYSAFIVADQVTVETRRAGLDAAEGVRWESDGQGEFTVERITREARGTTVTLHLKADEAEYAEPFRVESLIRKYSDHIGFPVSLESVDDEGTEARVVNAATALWTRSRSDVSDEEYKEFYKHLSHDFADPLSWSHNRVEGKREYTSLLYVPANAPFDLWNRDAPRGLKLYVQRVFIMDDAEQFLPLYLRFIKGVVDSSDLPLNVSRELLQQNPELTAMRSALTRRVLDMLAKIAKADSDDYQRVWDQFGQVLKEGVVEDFANKEKIVNLLRFASTHTGEDKQDQALEDYVGRMQDGQEEIYYIFADGYATAASSPHLEALKKRGLEVLILSDRIDPWMLNSLTDYDGKPLADISKADLKLPAADDEAEQAPDDHSKPLLEKMQGALKDRVESVAVSRRLVESPACVVAAATDLSPQVRQMLEASGQEVPDSKPILEINVSHPLLQRLTDEADDAKFSDLSAVILDHALLAEGTQLDNPSEYVRRINALLLDGAPAADAATG